MARHWNIPLALLLLAVVIQARPPSLYWPTGEERQIPTRTHLDENALGALNENELETLLYLLDKMDRTRILPNHQAQRYTYAQPHYDSRNKRTGHHSAQKKAVDWSDYFGIDKREVKSIDTKEDPLSASTPLPDAKNDKEREQILREFYANMAMAANVKRRKRAVRNPTMGKDMATVGDNLIWDALKLTGSHRGKNMSKDEFNQFKTELIRRIGAAYDLEKLRQVFEGNVNNFSNKNQTGQ